MGQGGASQCDQLQQRDLSLREGQAGAGSPLPPENGVSVASRLSEKGGRLAMGSKLGWLGMAVAHVADAGRELEVIRGRPWPEN